MMARIVPLFKYNKLLAGVCLKHFGEALPYLDQALNTKTETREGYRAPSRVFSSYTRVCVYIYIYMSRTSVRMRACVRVLFREIKRRRVPF